MVMLPIGRTVYAWRLHRRLTQEDLAEVCGIPRPNLSMIEQGGRDLTLSTLRRIAQALGIRPGVLADGLPPVSPSPRRWSRASFNRMAKVLAGIRVLLSREEKEAVKLLKPLITQKMRLFRKEAKRGLGRGSLRLEQRGLLTSRIHFQPEEIKNLLSRITKASARFRKITRSPQSS